MERNIRLDYYKIFLSILVITIHIPYFFADWKYISNVVARIAVPSFFILNGYFFAQKIGNPKRIKAYLIHLFVIYTTWFVIYLRPHLYQMNRLDMVWDFKILELSKLYFWGYFHIWYMPALIISVVLLLLMVKICKKDPVIMATALILYIAGCVLSIDVGHPDTHLVRNALFMGFPFVALGYFLSRREDLKKIEDKYLIATVVGSFILLILEATYLNVPSGRDFYVSLFIFCPSSILLFMKYPKSSDNLFVKKYLSPLSSAIYFSHVYVLFKSLTMFEGSSTERFVIVLLVTIPVSLFIVFINRYIKIFL